MALLSISPVEFVPKMQQQHLPACLSEDWHTASLFVKVFWVSEWQTVLSWPILSWFTEHVPQVLECEFIRRLKLAAGTVPAMFPASHIYESSQFFQLGRGSSDNTARQEGGLLSVSSDCEPHAPLSLKSTTLTCTSLSEALLTGTVALQGAQQVLVRHPSVGRQGAEHTEQNTFHHLKLWTTTVKKSQMQLSSATYWVRPRGPPNRRSCITG